MLVPLSPPAVLVDTSPLESQTLSDVELSPDSLFDEPQELSLTTPLKPQLPQGTRTAATAGPGTPGNYDDLTCPIARRNAPPIPGLFFDPGLLLPLDLADSVLHACMTSFFPPPGEVNQVMLFGRAGHEAAAFPPFLRALLEATATLLRRAAPLPAETHALLFPETAPDEGRETTAARARQAIVNLYRPGEGIAPHVDLLNRFGEGIFGVSLGGGVAMRFARVGGEGGGGGEYEVWLPPRSVIVLTGEARYGWTHGIPSRVRDKVEEEDGSGDGGDGWQWRYREPRVSVTFRWLLPGAEIVGGGGGGGESDSDLDEEDRRAVCDLKGHGKAQINDDLSAYDGVA